MIIDPQEKIRIVTQAIETMKGEATTLLDLRPIATFTDFFLLASVQTQTQMRAVVREIRTRLSEADGPPPRVDGEGASRWMVLDLGNVVVHLFDPPTRAFYRLEALWGDAPALDPAAFLTV